MGPGSEGEMPSLRVFLRDPIPYLCMFRRKLWKTPNTLVNKRDRGLNLEPPVFQFSALLLRHWWGFSELKPYRICLMLISDIVWIFFIHKKSYMYNEFKGILTRWKRFEKRKKHGLCLKTEIEKFTHEEKVCFASLERSLREKQLRKINILKYDMWYLIIN